MPKKYVVIIFGSVAGLVGEESVYHWPNYAAQIQMLLYTVIVLGSLLIGFWADRGREKVWKGICVVVLLHVALLVSIRSLFPFKTILAIIPMAIMEGTIAATLFLKLVGY
jgi:hypothetical protein